MTWYKIKSDLSGGVKVTHAGVITPGPITGDKYKPVGAFITGDPNNPVVSRVTGEKNNPVGAFITGDPGNPVGSQITGDKLKPVAVQLTGDPEQPVASTVELLNIPRLTLSDIKDIMTPKIRMHIPNYQQMSFKLLGVELFTWCMSGESEVITQPYVPNRFEECKIVCPDADMRPFPDDTPRHKQGNSTDFYQPK
jgi:hypothetical protein